jgi:hypothetical protein
MFWRESAPLILASKSAAAGAGAAAFGRSFRVDSGGCRRTGDQMRLVGRRRRRSLERWRAPALAISAEGRLVLSRSGRSCEGRSFRQAGDDA